MTHLPTLGRAALETLHAFGARAPAGPVIRHALPALAPTWRATPPPGAAAALRTGGPLRTVFTKVDHAPPGSAAPVFHGTSPAKAAGIAANGFDLRRSGENHAGSEAATRPAGVTGVFASTDPEAARLWGAFGNRIAREQVRLISLHPPQGNPAYQAVTVPQELHGSLARMREFMAARPEAHEFRIEHGESTEVIFTPRALADEAVEVKYRLDDESV